MPPTHRERPRRSCRSCGGSAGAYALFAAKCAWRDPNQLIL